jgi:hypothetical protein
MKSSSLTIGSWAVLDYWKRRYRALIVVVGVVVTAALGVALSGAMERAKAIVAGVVAFAPVIAALLTMSGIVSDDRESGLILMWFQKPARLFRTYAVRYAISLCVLLVLGALLGVVVTGISITGHLYPVARALRWVFPIWVLSSVTAAMVFAFSAWGARRDSTYALLTIVISFTIGARTVFDDSIRAQLIRAFAFPLDAAGVLAGSLNHISAQHALLIVLCHFAGWTLFGMLGLRFTEAALSRGK